MSRVISPFSGRRIFSKMAYYIGIGTEGTELVFYWYPTKEERDKEFKRWEQKGYIILTENHAIDPEKREEVKISGTKAGRGSFSLKFY